MKLIDLSGKIHNLDLSKFKYRSSSHDKSQYHLKTRELLNKLFPVDSVLEEVTIPGEGLYIDFLLVSRMLAIEVHGEQHYKFIPRFHKNYGGFLASKARDNRKSEWCEKNRIILVTLNYNETLDEWKDKIRNCWG